MRVDEERYESLIQIGRIKRLGLKLQKHRIIPRFQGGEYTIENTIWLTHDEHVEIHQIRFRLFGDVGDKRAACALDPNADDNEYWQKRNSSLKVARAARTSEGLARGGRVQGSRLKAEGWGIFGIDPIQDRLNRQKGARAMSAMRTNHDIVKGILNTRWVTNGLLNKRLLPDQVMPEGFRFGRASWK